LPEVEVVRRGLDSWVSGRVVERATVLDPRAVRRHGDGPRDLELSLAGASVLGAVRRGKFLWLPIRLADEAPDAAASVALMAHLGMSGQLLIEGASAPLERHARVILDLSERVDAPSQLRFVDQRLFGGLWLSPLEPTSDGLPGGTGSGDPSIPVDGAHVARDVLDPALEAGTLYASLHRRSTAIKAAILDQGVLSGVGNIYADEALWRARLHYLTPASRLSRAKVAELLTHLRNVMTDALAAGGTSFDSLYVNVNGASGYFDRSLNAYGREGEACAHCVAAARPGRIVREKWGGRSSYRCTRCQRVPRV
jgi:formamidopyrimidine-DNA glycosylase